MIEVKQSIKVYEKNGSECEANKCFSIGVNSHWNRDRMVILAVEGEEFGVLASDLINAIKNAQNTNRNGI